LGLKDLAGKAREAYGERQEEKQTRLNSLEGLDVANVRRLLGHSEDAMHMTLGWGTVGEAGLSDTKTAAIVNAVSANTHATLLVVKRLEQLIAKLDRDEDGTHHV